MVEANLAHHAQVKEASELGFAPGLWPASFVYFQVRYHYFSEDRDSENELIAVKYVSKDGEELMVLND